MYRIGDLANLAQVSVKTLRHYAELGLLKPAWIDRFTGYRYYNPDQLGHLQHILALKGLGFSLAQIKELLDTSLLAGDLLKLLASHKLALEQHLRTEQSRLEVLNAWLCDLNGTECDVRARFWTQCVNQQTVNHHSDKEIGMSYQIISLPAMTIVGLCYHGKENSGIPAMWGRFLDRVGEVARINPLVSYGICSWPAGLPEGVYEYVAGVQVPEDAPVPPNMVM
ncbi:MAG: MerR family transcriptional regulator, partial [Anaerolineae bacterium]